MDVTPITTKIEADARHAAEALLSEARARIENMQERCDDMLRVQQRDARSQAAVDGDQLEQNLRRLGQLEGRKALLGMKRDLLDQSFDQAREQLQNLPPERMGALMMEQLVRYAKGTERVMAGAIKPAFYGEQFLQEANRRLEAQGKPGKLHDAGTRREGVCGLVLEADGNETQLTVESLLAEHRAGLEGEVATLLFKDLD